AAAVLQAAHAQCMRQLLGKTLHGLFISLDGSAPTYKLMVVSGLLGGDSPAIFGTPPPTPLRPEPAPDPGVDAPMLVGGCGATPAPFVPS
ncbi:hypothetical protein, partial [Mycobacterium timonense]|uniref:hypothetical protein n=1 Tax=Mycobacterium timonense TaxID=701043 RepID=UPI001B8068EA